MYWQVSPIELVLSKILSYHPNIRDPRCTIILDGKDVSLLHARVKQVDGGVSLETLSKTHRVKLNGSLVLYGRELAMKDKDVVEIGKEKFTWNLHPNNTY